MNPIVENNAPTKGDLNYYRRLLNGKIFFKN